VASPFTPPNRAALWASLALTKAQLAALCGLSVRQVSHWTARGYLPRSTRNPEHYSGGAVDVALLMKQGLDQGLSLGQAVRLAQAYLAAEQSRQPDLHALDAAALAAIAT
jgi:DNA-binding transcriptional MerR regulator